MYSTVHDLNVVSISLEFSELHLLGSNSGEGMIRWLDSNFLHFVHAFSCSLGLQRLLTVQDLVGDRQ